ncbi:uncharacterized protein LOC132941624 [Metopolophium dirhodum]|uniref:uncharacterized protein LOC132941624 n=1 Tax=Metopolophium dirhodum TaxID=44670 RepID=UPI00298F902B|nr:uncharacterized protein LOC132941624 [Metopolophium dirhodum]
MHWNPITYPKWMLLMLPVLFCKFLGLVDMLELQNEVEEASFDYSYRYYNDNLSLDISEIQGPSTQQLSPAQNEIVPPPSRKDSVDEIISPGNPNQPRKKNKKNTTNTIDHKIDEAFNILKRSASSFKSNSSDECTTYGAHVANKIRSYPPQTRAIVQHYINNILFDADMGRYDYYSANPHILFQNPVPQTNLSSYYSNTHIDPSNHSSSNSVDIPREFLSESTSSVLDLGDHPT